MPYLRQRLGVDNVLASDIVRRNGVGAAGRPDAHPHWPAVATLLLASYNPSLQQPARLTARHGGGQCFWLAEPNARASLCCLHDDARLFSLAEPFAYCDVTDRQGLARLVVEHRISYIVHMASVLSAVGEANPALALQASIS